MQLVYDILVTLSNWTLTAIYFLVVITIIAVIHELGHYLICKLTGVRVDEFSVGFGRLLFGRKWGETDYSIRAIPIAAYVRPAGMLAEGELDFEEGYVDPGERGFNRKSSPVKYSILLGGPVANIISTVGVLTILYAFIGEGPSTIEVHKVGDKSPAQRVGIRPGDIILGIDKMDPIRSDRKAILYIRRHPGQEITVRLRRSNEIRLIRVVPDSSTGEGLIGIQCKPYRLSETPIALPVMEAYALAKEETWGYVTYAYMQALTMLKGAFSKREIPQELGGPVSIVSAVGSIVKRGATLADLLQMLAILSMAIGVFNLLPIPALDGGRIFVLAIRDLLDIAYTLIVWKKPSASIFSQRIEDLAHLAGFFFLIFLLIVVTYKDIRDMVTSPKPTMPSFSAPASPSPVPTSGR